MKKIAIASMVFAGMLSSSIVSADTILRNTNNNTNNIRIENEATATATGGNATATGGSVTINGGTGSGNASGGGTTVTGGTTSATGGNSSTSSDSDVSIGRRGNSSNHKNSKKRLPATGSGMLSIILVAIASLMAIVLGTKKYSKIVK